MRHPPGNEIYREEKISMLEVDGTKEIIYCQNLSYLSKLFLEHKNLEEKTDDYLHYILTEYDKYGYHFVGFFSKEKESLEGWNLSCILTLPFHQRKRLWKIYDRIFLFIIQKGTKIGNS